VIAQDWLALLLDLATLADRIALQWFRREHLDVGEKPDRSPVTAADLEIERALRSAALARHPRLGILGEEYGTNDGRNTRLIIDPIDGTANFARGIPIFATLLAIEREREIIAGVASAPALATRWFAARGQGAYRNGVRIAVSAIDRFADAQVFHGGLAGDEGLERVPGLMRLLRACKRQRGFGDFYQHMLVAEGAGEIAVELELAAWDIAAPSLIVEEAGGRATGLHGERDIRGGCLVSTNALLHEATLALLSAEGGARPA